MAKYSGNVGFVMPEVEVSPGIWKPSGVVEKLAHGDVISAAKRYSGEEKINDDLAVSNRISIVANDFMMSNHSRIRYATLYGSRWKVREISFNRPRIILTLGGLWNGEIPAEEA